MGSAHHSGCPATQKRIHRENRTINKRPLPSPPLEWPAEKSLAKFRLCLRNRSEGAEKGSFGWKGPFPAHSPHPPHQPFWDSPLPGPLHEQPRAQCAAPSGGSSEWGPQPEGLCTPPLPIPRALPLLKPLRRGEASRSPEQRPGRDPKARPVS